jgi:hypothetical protein
MNNGIDYGHGHAGANWAPSNEEGWGWTLVIASHGQGKVHLAEVRTDEYDEAYGTFKYPHYELDCRQGVGAYGALVTVPAEMLHPAAFCGHCAARRRFVEDQT